MAFHINLLHNARNGPGGISLSWLKELQEPAGGSCFEPATFRYPLMGHIYIPSKLLKAFKSLTLYRTELRAHNNSKIYNDCF